MTDARNAAIARALVNLYYVLAEFDQAGDPEAAMAEGSKYVALAIQELIGLSPAYDGDELEDIIPQASGPRGNQRRRSMIS
ncbi:hypothetical protein M2323_001427 [Rhodoblastus acidophilus]|uniref:hypothetical protein n=1 Tax=Rhodoblastus acidophilus TaxID=1074 RepID=UPI0022255FF0|nr:hypothetical protein [Rhodoblastus acidophilus]MCW2283655.1 hypothetical protein [Rhodoblastus acidophilus]MCW2332515.1 hypothetical protein [Rhodoblastus acidophilus]